MYVYKKCVLKYIPRIVSIGKKYLFIREKKTTTYLHYVCGQILSEITKDRNKTNDNAL